jgi:2-polyprenyl-3-methyl-5-hydroxy-6-metoxy-1,4-benzoquinol methylase
MIKAKIPTWRKIEKVQPYSALGPIYDYVMDHVDYQNWARYLATLIKKHGDHLQRVLDISCGTGNLLPWLTRAGFTVYGCDSAVSMVHVARKKNTGQRIWCGDVRHPALRRGWQVILSTYDSMNYLMSAKEWLDSLQQIYGLLEPGGLFIFDVSTLHNSQTLFQRYVQKEKTPLGVYHRASYFRKREQIQINEFKIKMTSVPGVTWHEVHRQKILALEQVLAYLAQTPFILSGSYADFTQMPARESAERVHFVVQKGRSRAQE